MAQDYRIAIAIAKHKHKNKKKTEAGKQNAPSSNTWGKSDYEKWMNKQLKKDR
jgi:hypothetical protein